MSKVEKITEEQLKELQEIISTSNKIKLEIGNVEAQKHFLLHEFAAVTDKMNDMQDKLEEEYGKINVDINTGDISYPEEK
jgi:short-subunit dehydrogenase involved in D-alanine esterification of teichoic acids